MCVVSMVGDHYKEKWIPQPNQPFTIPVVPEDPIKKFEDLKIKLKPEITRQEFEDLKKEVEEMKKILQKAKEYDERTNQPHCEMESKVALLKQVAALVGVSLEDVFDVPGK